MINPIQFAGTTASQQAAMTERRKTKQSGDQASQEGESFSRKVWRGHPTERPKDWAQAELPR